MATLLVVLAVLLFPGACHRKKTTVMTADDLAFPLVRITGTASGGTLPSRAVVLRSRDELDRMRVELFSELSDTTRSDPPVVIDSAGVICEMREIEGQRGGLWMMVNPTGLMPITCKLVRRDDSGVIAARALISKCRFLGTDLDSERTALRRARIAAATTMAEIVEIVEERPEPREPD